MSLPKPAELAALGVSAIVLVMAGFTTGTAADGGIELHVDGRVIAGIVAVVAVAALVLVRARLPAAFDELITVLLAVWVLGLLLLLGWLLLSVWGALPPAENDSTVKVHWLGTKWSWTASERTAGTALVLLAGGLGGAVHTARSFATRTGAATFASRWAWWYLLTPAISAVAALMVSAGIRSGLVDSGADAANPDSQASITMFIAFVSGLFARTVLERLERYLPRPEQRSRITLTQVDPPKVAPSATGQTFTLRGIGFTPDTTVRIGGLKASKVTLADRVLTAEFTDLQEVPAGDLYLIVENTETVRAVAIVNRT